VSFAVVLFGSNSPPHPPSYHTAFLTSVGDPDPHVFGRPDPDPLVRGMDLDPDPGPSIP
jgi:hypothetical protein